MLLLSRYIKIIQKFLRRRLLHGFAFECYYCGKFFARADKQKIHIENCSGVQGIIYNFKNKNLITFKDNFK